MVVYLVESPGAKESLDVIMENADRQTRTTVETYYDVLIDRGQTRGKQAIIRRLLELRFGPLPSHVHARLENASVAELDAWTERLLSAASLDEVLAG